MTKLVGMRKVPIWGVTTEPVRKEVELMFADYEKDRQLPNDDAPLFGRVPPAYMRPSFYSLQDKLKGLLQLGAISKDFDAEITARIKAAIAE